MIIGISKDIEAQLITLAATHHCKPEDFLSRKPGVPELRVRYDRGNGDLTSWLPSTLHMTYLRKGWTAVALQTDDAAGPIAEARA